MARIPGLAIGLAIGVVGVVAAPVLARHLRPVGKAALLAAMAASDELMVRLAEMVETAEDMMAEVRAERAARHANEDQAAAAATEESTPAAEGAASVT